MLYGFAIVLAIFGSLFPQPERSGKTKINEIATTLVTPGVEPRRRIRFAPPVGSAYIVRLALNVSVGREVDGKREDPVHSPEIILTLRTEAVDLPDNGGTLYEALITDADIVTRTGVSKELLDQSSDYFKKCKGSTLTFRLGPRGQVWGERTKLPAVEDRKEDDVAWFVNKQIHFMNDVLFHCLLVFPQDEVGPGSKWKTVEPWAANDDDQYLREYEVTWAGDAKGEPRVRAAITAEWKSPTQIQPKTERTVANQALNLSGSFRGSFLPNCPFPSDAEYKIVNTWQVLAKRPDKLVPGTFMETFEVRVTTKPELAKPKGAK